MPRKACFKEHKAQAQKPSSAKTDQGNGALHSMSFYSLLCNTEFTLVAYCVLKVHDNSLTLTRGGRVFISTREYTASTPTVYLCVLRFILRFTFSHLQAPLLPPEAIREDAPPDPIEPPDEGEDDVVEEDEDPFETLMGNNEDDKVAEIGAYLLDWMGTNKATWESAKEVWHMLGIWCGFDLPVFYRVKGIAQAWLKGRAQLKQMCKNGCVAYINCTHPKLQGDKYQNEGME